MAFDRLLSRLACRNKSFVSVDPGLEFIAFAHLHVGPFVLLDVVGMKEFSGNCVVGMLDLLFGKDKGNFAIYNFQLTLDPA